MNTKVNNEIEKSKEKVKVKGGIRLYTEDHLQLGLIMRPVKIIKIPPITQETIKTGFNASAAAKPIDQNNKTPQAPAAPVTATDLKKAQDNIATALGALQAKLIQNSAQVIKTDAEEYGPYITLPLPEKIKDTLKLNYSTTDLGMMAVGAMFADDVAKSFAGDSGGLAKSMAGSASYVIRTLLQGIAPGAGGVTQKVAGNIPNPFSAAIFEKAAPRSFNFSWTVQPKNAQESLNLREIINNLRYWSLPNPSKDRLALDVPYEWILSFVGTNFLYSFSRCVMTDLDIDFSPNGFNVFMDAGGGDAAPQSVTISVSFQEIFPLDKASIDGTYNAAMTPTTAVSPRADSSDMTDDLNRLADAEAIAQREIRTSASKEAEKYDQEVKTIQEEISKKENKFAFKNEDGTIKRDGAGNAVFPTTFTGDIEKGNVRALKKQLDSAQAKLATAKADSGG